LGNNKNILLCPLDWGLGHSTRCIPIILKLVENNYSVFVCGNETTRRVILSEVPQVKFVYFKGYNINYSKSIPFLLKIFLQFPKILFRIIAEHHQLKKIIKENDINVVISDNRFGLWNKKIKSIYITHQIMIKCPKNLKVFEFLLYSIHNFFINKYSECWIPDNENANNLSGDLSHKYPVNKNTFYIGPLSRFCSPDSDSRTKKQYDILFLISGPEPQRTVFEKIALNSASITPLKIAIVRGVIETTKAEINSEHFIVNYASAVELNNLINNSELIISRSGYSTIMDLAMLGKNAILIPTPGQTEQEYLAEYLRNKGCFFYMTQCEFSLKKAVEEAKNYSGIRIQNNYNLLSERVCKL
jgi:uncharacterized protein (TIGR00661 family)